MDLLLAPLGAGVILVEAGEVAVVALVEGLVAGDRDAGLPALLEDDVAGALGTAERRGEGEAELEALRRYPLARRAGFGDALLA